MAWRLRASAASGWHEYAAIYPWRVMLATTLPRVLLQCLFIVLIGRLAAGESGGRFAFVGAVAYLITLASVVTVTDVVVNEKYGGTWWRTRLGVLPPPVVVAARSWPYLLQSVVTVAICILVVGPLAGMGDLALRLLAFLPLYALMCVTVQALGLFGAALGAGRRAEVVVGNTLAYLVLLAGGVLVERGRVPLLDVLGAVLPTRHGLLAVRAALDGEAYGGHVAAEVAVGAGWAALAAGLLLWQCARARRLGLDDFE